MEMTVGQATKKHREKQGLNQEKFVAALNEKLVNVKITRQAVSNWEKDKNVPDTDYLLICLMVYVDWRMEWAIDCLIAKLPNIFKRDRHGALTTLKKELIQE